MPQTFPSEQLSLDGLALYGFKPRKRKICGFLSTVSCHAFASVSPAIAREEWGELR
jgi:hypothetical protein